MKTAISSSAHEVRYLMIGRTSALTSQISGNSLINSVNYYIRTAGKGRKHESRFELMFGQRLTESHNHTP